MLIEFSVGNYRSFKDLTTFSMVAASFKEYEESHVINKGGKNRILKSGVIYGGNGSGKSNFLNAMGFLKRMIINSFRDALTEENSTGFNLDKFSLSTVSANEPAIFEIVFISNEIRYRYGFEIMENFISAEWLFHTTSKEVYLFTRDGQDIKINKSAFKEGLGKEGDVRENVLFLSVLATLNKDISSNIVTWFQNFNIISGINDRTHKRYTIDKLKSDNEFANWTSNFIKFLEISKMDTSEEDSADIDIESFKQKSNDEELVNFVTTLQKFTSQRGQKRDQLITYHRVYDENNIMVDTVSFNFDLQESEGTKKLIYLLGPWYDTLKNGKVLVIDELDSRLHCLLTLKLIEFFHHSNNSNAQLICAVHDVSLLNKETFRRDQIWFIDKNQFGASELVCLADFKSDKVRVKSAFDKSYLDGKYGAIPYFDKNQSLNF